jgi:tetratricopeptide (TPR) repeat protein
LRGRKYLFTAGGASRDELELAVQMFERAVRLDPDFAGAYAGLGAAHVWMSWFGYDRSPEREEQAREALKRATELEPAHPVVRQASGLYMYMVERDYDRALGELSLAAKGLPSDPIATILVAAVYRRRGDWDEATAWFEKGAELDPRNPAVLAQLGSVYMYLRRYREADRILSQAISLAPDQPVAYGWRANNYRAWTGDVAAARALIEEAPYESDDASTWDWFNHKMLERDYLGALARVELTSLDWIELIGFAAPKRLLAGLAYRQLDRPDEARAAFEEARIALEDRLHQRPEDERLHSALGIALAGLGRKEEAIDEGKRGLELLPVSKDALIGPFRLVDLASIYTMVGEADAALDQIEQLLSIPSFFSVRLLELDPMWDPLRDHPRYQEIVKKYALSTPGTSWNDNHGF